MGAGIGVRLPRFPPKINYKGVDNITEEIWLKLVYPGIEDAVNRFEVSSCGRLRNAISKHIYKLDILSSGYCSVRTTLGSNKRKIHIILHKAVAYTFLPNPNKLPEVNHKDGDRTNNNANNLEWCTSHYNQQHKYDMGFYDKNKISGENNPASKLTWDDVRYIRENYQPGVRGKGLKAMAKMFGVSSMIIQCVVKNKTWKEPLSTVP